MHVADSAILTARGPLRLLLFTVPDLLFTRRAPIAQLDRASDFESEGRRFESCWVHQISKTRKGRRSCRPFVFLMDSIELQYALAYARATAPNSLWF